MLISIWITFVWAFLSIHPEYDYDYANFKKRHLYLQVSLGTYHSENSRNEHFSSSKIFDKAAFKIGPNIRLKS